MPKKVERCVKQVKGVKNPWAVCMAAYKKGKKKR